MRFYTENVQHDYCTHKEFPSLFLHARHLLPAADHGKECGSDRYYATASICIISYSVEPRQFNANTAFFHFYEHFHPLTPKQAHLSVCLFSVYYSLSILRPAVSYHRISRSDIVLAAMMASQQTSGAAHSALPSPCGASLGYALFISSSVPMIPRFLIRQPLPSYRQHHRPVQTRRRFPRPSPPVHGISR